MEFSKKTPDISIYPHGRPLPTVAPEVGYSESYEDLVSDADHLLKDSYGSIGLMILIKHKSKMLTFLFIILCRFCEC
jgi:hypothetical protein